MFLKNFISDNRKIKIIVSSSKYSLKSSQKYKETTFSSFRIEDKNSDIDFLEIEEGGTLFLFMSIHHKGKRKKWSAEDYFNI